MLSRLKGIETPDAKLPTGTDFPLDMLSRLKGIETFLRHRDGARVKPLDMLSRLKGIETQRIKFSQVLFGSLDMLSRLKGIETRFAVYVGVDINALWICFPVWRELKPVYDNDGNRHLGDFGYAFPFEGNWNRLVRGGLGFLILPLDMLSRLKGIETVAFRDNKQIYFQLWICFPVWRELKHDRGHQ